MKKIKQLAICMDHSNAFLMELYNHMIISRKIISRSKDNEEQDNHAIHSMPIEPAEKLQLQKSFYKEISDIIKNYQQVVLFGPTDANVELYKLLEADHSFENTKIELVNTDKMTDNQMHDFVKKYYK